MLDLLKLGRTLRQLIWVLLLVGMPTARLAIVRCPNLPVIGIPVQAKDGIGVTTELASQGWD